MLLEAGVPNMSFRPKDWRNDITCKFWPDCKCGDACPYKHDPAVLENARRLRLEAQQQAASSRRSAAEAAAPSPPPHVLQPRRAFSEGVPAPPLRSTEETGRRAGKRTFTEMAGGAPSAGEARDPTALLGPPDLSPLAAADAPQKLVQCVVADLD
eukprot:EG_transcript_30915